MKLTKVISLVLALALVLSMATVAFADKLDDIKTAGKLVVETEATYPPYEYLDDEGKPAGCDIFLAQQIADAIGVELEIMDTAFDSIIMDIKGGQGDLGIAAFTIDEERAEKIDFSDSYEASMQLLVVKAGNEDLYATKEGLAGLKVGAQMGTIQSKLVTKVFGEDALFELEAYGPLSLEVANGNIAGFVADAEVAEAYVAASDGKLAVSNFAFTAEEANFGKAIVVKKGEAALMAIVNEVIAKVLADGSYQAAKDAAVAESGAAGD